MPDNQAAFQRDPGMICGITAISHLRRATAQIIVQFAKTATNQNPVMNSARRFFPFLAWFPLRPGSLRADLIAGLTVALLAIPQSLAYAQLAGVPPYYGLYAALIPTVIGALFGSSAVLSTGPVALTSLLTAASVSQLAAHGSEQYLICAILLALLSGVLQMAFGILRLGALLNFLSYPVLMGFINAAAIIIGLSQLPALLGVPAAQTEHFLADIWHVVERFDLIHAMSLLFGITAILALFAFKKYAPRLPGVLITVGTLTVASFLSGYENTGGRVVGDIPQGMPSFGLPAFDGNVILMLMPAAFVIALISFMEAMSSCKVIAIKTRAPWNENQELIGQGLAKIASALSHSIPVSGSFSRSALNLSVNAATGLSSVISAACVLLTLLFFTPLLHHLPKPVLAAIIIVALANLVDFSSIAKSWRARGDDGIAAIATFVITIASAPSIQFGILAGMLLSIALLLFRMMRPRVTAIGGVVGDEFRDTEGLLPPALPPKLAALRFDRSLFFVNASFFEGALIELERNNPQLEYILVIATGINEIDASGIEMLFNVQERFKLNGISIGFSGIKRQVRDVMDRTGLGERIGADNFFASDQEALHELARRYA
jgi:SulP family sulfate permease